jgi:hypothetical protein
LQTLLQDGLSVVGGNNNANIHGGAKAALLLDTLPRKERDSRCETLRERNFQFGSSNMLCFEGDRLQIKKASHEIFWRFVGRWSGNSGIC